MNPISGPSISAGSHDFNNYESTLLTSLFDCILSIFLYENRQCCICNTITHHGFKNRKKNQISKINFILSAINSLKRILTWFDQDDITQCFHIVINHTFIYLISCLKLDKLWYGCLQKYRYKAEVFIDNYYKYFSPNSPY